MCTSPTTVYSCGHTKPDRIIEFCYADNEGDCGQIHTRFEHLPRKCPGCTRRAHSELERKRGVPSSEYGEQVKDTAGPAKRSKDFLFHSGLLFWASAYFKNYFAEDRFKEGKERQLRLTNDHPHITQRFMEWLYHGRVLPAGFGTIRSQAPLRGVITTRTIYELYVFADCRRIRGLKNDIVDTVADILARTWVRVPIREIIFIYQHTAAGDSMRRLLTSYMVFRGPFPVDRIIGERRHEFLDFDEVLDELLLDYVSALETYSRRSSKLPTRELWCTLDRCEFYDHNEELGDTLTEAAKEESEGRGRFS
ncbi:hypothetical protein SLS58_007228 [Diplodia intermedia]|uniref:BTB domain-containing protein n=1 Tax=Diplodia intermedia TaxID=856260 RepID=A0ABR3TL62_9PEZI